MADNVLITQGSGTTVGTDDRGGVHIQRVDPIGTTAVATGQVNVTTTAATLLADRSTRRRVTFVNQGAATVYIGPATVTAANGFKLAAGAGVTLETTALLQAISASGTQSVHYVEEYDS